MKRVKYLIVIVVVLVSVAACNELLDQMPNNSISGSSMWLTESQADQGVLGVYQSMKETMYGNSLAGEDVYIGHFAWDAFGMTGQASIVQYGGLMNASFLTSNYRLPLHWRWGYTGIHRANNAIAYIPGIPMNEDKKARLVAECKVLRAFFYMRTNELFGSGGLGIPLYLEPVSPTECDKGQTPEAEIWAQIIQDLTDAINTPALPDNQIGGDGRVSKGAAYAFRGRAYLFTKEYDKAIVDFAKVGECGYKLYPDYKALFKRAQRGCEEIIFSLQHIEDPAGYGSRVNKYYAAGNQGGRDAANGWNSLTPTMPGVDLYEVVVDENTVKSFNWSDFFPEWESLSIDDRKVFFLRDRTVNGMEIHATVSAVIDQQINTLSEAAKALYLSEGNETRIKAAYANRDPRLAAAIVTPYANFLGVSSNYSAEGWYTFRWPVPGLYYFDQASAEPNANPDLPADYYASGGPQRPALCTYIYRKFVGEGREFIRRDNAPVDDIICRYGDVLLLWAEALVENNDLNGAMAKVKEVRDRAGLATMASSFADQTTARNYIRDERRRELVGEGINFWDEMRWRTLKETKFDYRYPHNVWGGTTGYLNYQWIGDKFYTWPVPSNEIQRNPNLTRTPGWDY